MALARTRRGDSGMNYWPGFVDALSTLILGIIFILTVFVVVQFYLQQEVAGKDTALTRLNAQIAQLTDLLSMEKTGKANLRGPARAVARLARHRRERPRQIQGPRRRRRRRRRRGAGQGLRTHRPARRREEDFRQRAGAGRDPQPADRGAAPPARRDRDRARRLREEGQGVAEQDRRSRPAAQRGAGAEGAGADQVPLRLLRQAARDPRQPARRARRRRPLRAAIGSVLRHRQGRPQAGRRPPSSTRWPARWSNWRSRSRPISPGCCASTATPTCGRSPAAQFKSNWDLSAARAIAVVQYLVGKGVSPQRLVAAGFGEFQPIDTGTTEDAYRRNRRIEFKLTER